jgi:general secretion pathway protein A
MYLEYFKLSEYPFRLTPDTDFLYMSPGHARGKAYMDYAIWNRDGFVVITGEIGCGKTTLIQKLLSELDDSVVVAKVFQTQIDEVEFLQAVLVEFGLNPFNAKKVELIDMLNTFLIDQFMQHKQLVLIVDDAHNLSSKVLEELRMLSGLETRKEKILHIILVGQPALNDLLDGPGMEQLLQRVRLRHHIRPLTPEETRDYVFHRVRVGGCPEPEKIFDENAFPVVHKYTGGTPRLINTLCDTALTCAYADGSPMVTEQVMATACEELQWLPYAKRVSRSRANRTEHTTEQSSAAIQDNLRLLMSIDSKMQNFDALVPTLNLLSKQMGELNTVLQSLAAKLDSQSPQDNDSQPKRFRIGK